MFSCDDLSTISLMELMAAKNWQTQYRLIIQWGALIQPKIEWRKSVYLIKGCEVSAWLIHAQDKDIHRFAFDSDSRVINGLAALLLAQVDNKTTEEINAVNFSKMLLDVGLEKHLTPSRNNGLGAIIARVKECMSYGRNTGL